MTSAGQLALPFADCTRFLAFLPGCERIPHRLPTNVMCAQTVLLIRLTAALAQVVAGPCTKAASQFTPNRYPQNV